MTLLLLISGNPDAMKQHIKDVVEIVKIDDKIVSQLGRIKNIIAEHSATRIVVGTKDLKYQRFQTIWKLLFLYVGKTNSMLIDDSGSENVFSFSKLVFVEFPLLIAECFASAFMIAWAYIVFPRLQRKKNQ